MNTAADFLFRLDLNPIHKVLLQIREDIQTTPIQVNIQSSDIHEEDKFYFLPADDTETEEDIWERQQNARKNIYTPQTNRRLTHLIQTLQRRIYYWYVTTYKTRIMNKGLKSSTTTTSHAASGRIKTRTPSSATSNLKY